MNEVSPLSIAPMIKWTDRHWRYFFRGITRRTLLYSEMILGDAIVYNPSQIHTFLGHDAIEHPLAIQLGGCDPVRMGEAAYIVSQYDSSFQEINLNAGCPSNKAKRIGYGAELMLQPLSIQQILYEMQKRATNMEISLKCRLGVTGKDSYDDLTHLLHLVRDVGVRKVIIHARQCILTGLSPAQNRSVPPLHPEVVHQLVHDFPDLTFILNGGLTDLTVAQDHLHTIEQYPGVHGVMIGREAYHHPFAFSHVDCTFFHSSCNQNFTRRQVLHRYLDYIQSLSCHDEIEIDKNEVRCCNVIKPLHHFFHHTLANHSYKHLLDERLLYHSKKLDEILMSTEGDTDGLFRQFVMDIVQESVPAEILDLQPDHPHFMVS